MPYPHQRRTFSLRGTLLPADMNLLSPNNGQTVVRGTPGAVALTSTGQQVVNPLAPQQTGQPVAQQPTPPAPITQNVGSPNRAAPGVIPSVPAQQPKPPVPPEAHIVPP